MIYVGSKLNPCQNRVHWAIFAVLNSLWLEIPTDLTSCREYVFCPSLLNMAKIWFYCRDPSVRSNVERLFGIWKDRKVYGAEFVEELKDVLSKSVLILFLLIKYLCKYQLYSSDSVTQIDIQHQPLPTISKKRSIPIPGSANVHAATLLRPLKMKRFTRFVYK